jgi:magnesium-protoporphyrin IX monomethyl ester (oxidative) cyclase
MTMWKKFLCLYPHQKQEGMTYDDLHPPLGLEIIAASARDLAEKIVIVDMRYERKPISSFLEGVDIAGFSLNWSHQREPALDILRRIPRGFPVILGGIHATQNTEEYFISSPRVDIIVRGDGEETIREILSGRPLSEIKGISYRHNGVVVHNESRPLSPLGDIYPDRTLRRYHYQYQMPLGLNIGMDCVMSSRGCSYNCEFCTFKEDSSGRRRLWSGRSAESVVDEIEQIPSDIVVFCDDSFGEDLQRVEKICDLILVRKIKKLIGCELRIEISRRPDILRKMNRAGFWGLSFGLESCQDKTLRRIKKGFTVQDVRDAFDVFRRLNFFYLGYFIVGYLGENKEEMLEIPDFAAALGLDFIGLTCLRAFKDSRIRKVVEGTPGYHFGKGEEVYSDGCSLEGLDSIRNRILKKFYSPSHMLMMIRKYLFGGVPKKPFLKFMVALMLSEFAGKRRRFPLGHLG